MAALAFFWLGSNSVGFCSDMYGGVGVELWTFGLNIRRRIGF